MPERLLARFGHSTPTSGVRGALTGSAEHLLPRLYDYAKIKKNKSCREDLFSGGGSYFCAHNLDLEGPGPHVLLEPWSIIFRQRL